MPEEEEREDQRTRALMLIAWALENIEIQLAALVPEASHEHVGDLLDIVAERYQEEMESCPRN